MSDYSSSYTSQAFGNGALCKAKYQIADGLIPKSFMNVKYPYIAADAYTTQI